MNFSELKSSYDAGTTLLYSDLLKTEEWKVKRDEIIERDDHKCTVCGSQPTTSFKRTGDNKILPVSLSFSKLRSLLNCEQQKIFDGSQSLHFSDDFKRLLITFEIGEVKSEAFHLEVHHKMYILDELPWNYSSDQLTTLCNHCHTDLHKNSVIPIYTNDKKRIVNFDVCTRCSGVGHLPEYNHVQNGICFKCEGARYLQPLIRYKI
jgi:hypothetical protein